MRCDVVVIGAGAAGSALAARLSEDPATSVIVVEAGDVPCADDELPAEIREAGSLRAARSGHRWNRGFPVQLAPGRDWEMVRGQGLGGSTSINGGYFQRPHPYDLDEWSRAGGCSGLWRPEAMLEIFRRSESDADYGSRAEHGSSGPMPVQRVWTERPDAGSGPLDGAFFEACRDQGWPEESDKNSGGRPGVGPLPLNIIQGMRRNAGLQYLVPAMTRPNLRVLGETRVLRVLFHGHRAVGVEVVPQRDGRPGFVRCISAGEVVVAAGAPATAHLLLVSGVGDAQKLTGLGVQAVADVPGVGESLSDHPDISFPLLLRAGLSQTQGGESAPAAPITVGLNASSYLDDGRGDLELLLAARSQAELFGARDGDFAQRTYSMMLGLQTVASRGRMSLISADPTAVPRVEYDYLCEEGDRRRMRSGVRLALRVLEEGPLAERVEEHPAAGQAPSQREVEEDDRLDAWIMRNLGTRFHTCGGAVMGPEGDPHAVVSSEGRVWGVEGLRVADQSILPSVPSRGTASTAVFLGELIAQSMKAG